MTDIEKATSLLTDGKTCVLCKDNTVYESSHKGIAPMLGFIADVVPLNGFSAADKIVGKAAALLFIHAGISEVYAEVLSKSALDTLTENGVKFSYGTLCDSITNRSGTGICPMEQTVEHIDNPLTAFQALKRKYDSLKNGN